jgi:hypothetical protein
MIYAGMKFPSHAFVYFQLWNLFFKKHGTNSLVPPQARKGGNL